MNIENFAEQAGWNQGVSYDDCIACSAFDMKKFAELIAAHEREECAKLCDAHGLFMTAREIRARGKA